MTKLEEFQQFLEAYQPQPLGQEKVYAVLLPLIEVAGDCHVLYQVRSQHISQPREVAFPGGRVETGENPRQAALRETMEELNLSDNQIDILGELDYLVYQDRTIHCFVGQLKVEDWQEIQPNKEVERLFTVPLSQLIEQGPTYYQLEASVDENSAFPFERINGGADYPFSHHRRQIPFYDHLDENIWGMTAQFTHRFIQLVQEWKD